MPEPSPGPTSSTVAAPEEVPPQQRRVPDPSPVPASSTMAASEEVAPPKQRRQRRRQEVSAAEVTALEAERAHQRYVEEIIASLSQDETS